MKEAHIIALMATILCANDRQVSNNIRSTFPKDYIHLARQTLEEAQKEIQDWVVETV